MLIIHDRMPSLYMINSGKWSSHFFDSYTDASGNEKLSLKTLEQHSKERYTSEQSGKQHFEATTLADIIARSNSISSKKEQEKGGCVGNNPTSRVNICCF